MNLASLFLVCLRFFYVGGFRLRDNRPASLRFFMAEKNREGYWSGESLRQFMKVKPRYEVAREAETAALKSAGLYVKTLLFESLFCRHVKN
jgi:hypothetical protein